MVNSAIFASALLAAVSVSASPVPQSGSSEASTFKIQAKLRAGGPSNFDGLFIEPFHTGAGENALVAVKEDGVSFVLKDGYITNYEGTPSEPYNVGLNSAAPYNSTAPAGDLLTTCSVDGATQGFYVNKHGYFGINADNFKTFVLCNVNGVAPYQSVGPEVQLLWSKSLHTATSQCADVELHPVVSPA